MRKIMFLTVLLCLVVFVMPAYADKKPKDVNVVNTPDVTVVNDAANPLTVTVQPDGLTVNVSSVYRFVNYSTATTTGSAGGFIGMHAICQAEFGDSARMCTQEEFWKSHTATPLPPPGGSTFRAWVQPTIIAVYVFSGERFHVDWLGGVFQSKVSCGNWTLNEPQFDRGLVYQSASGTEQGIWGADRCDSNHHVVCCTPGGEMP
jgi:hypothetical protein